MLEKGYGIMPNKVLFDTNISSTAKLVFVLISSLSASEGYCWASNKYLGEKLGIAVSTISAIVSDLEKAGYLNVRVERSAGNKRKISIGILKNHATYTEKSVDPYAEKSVHNSISNNITTNTIIKNSKALPVEATFLASVLAKGVLENFDFMKQVDDKQLRDWAGYIDKLHRIDGYDWKMIEGVILWSLEHNFWKQQIRSGNNLRKHFEKMLVQIKSEPTRMEVIS